MTSPGWPSRHDRVDREKASQQLMMALEARDSAEVCRQIENGADLGNTLSAGQSPLMVAATNGDGLSAVVLLHAGGDVNQPDFFGRTPLMGAVMSGNDRLVDVFSARDEVIIDARDDKGRTALCWALKRKNPLIMISLIQSGADANQLDHHGRNMLSAVIMDLNDHHLCGEVVAALLKAGARIDAIALQDHAALIHAARLGKLALVRQLCEAGADLNVRGNLERTALMNAAVQNHADVVTVLLDRGAMIDLRDQDEASALTLAVSKGHIAVVRVLLGRNPVINNIDLMAAGKREDIRTLLIEQRYRNFINSKMSALSLDDRAST